ncbi:MULTISPECIES: pentapeptide repeat-containing protein [unclassified Brevundimonas]|uniref:pentapeptide repeat-containing protein n=1 Tax=unclassified Brevundimonas TaxID=2622653 RepID=UPI0025C096EC|nr:MULTISPECIES: pentapeptide repeat-containing protein [unclassified Brevundimonas]
MRIRLPIVLTVLALATTPAVAQNRAQIDSVRNGQSCPRCNLFQADLTRLERSNLNLTGARLRQADLSLTVLNRARLAGADLRDLNAFGAVMQGADFSGADLTNASLVGASLRNADWTGAKLEGANLSGSDLRGARGLSMSQISRACGDSSTQLPQGLNISSC